MPVLEVQSLRRVAAEGVATTFNPRVSAFTMRIAP